MASGLPTIELPPDSPPPTPTIVTPDDDDDAILDLGSPSDDAPPPNPSLLQAPLAPSSPGPPRLGHHPNYSNSNFTGGSDSNSNSNLSSGLLRPPTPTFTLTMAEPIDIPSAGGDAPSPFNFKTQFISTSPVKSNIGQRRGHRYKHSSISAQHQIFQEPPPRPPPVLPASLPVPTLKEAWASIMYRKDQRLRFYWCCCHAAVAVYVFFAAEGSLAMTALSHLVFFDVGSAAVCVAVDVLGNFEVWRRSSIRHPFGLQRAEVLAGFAMSVFLVFGGFDLLSHNLKHVLESAGEHAPHHPHASPPHEGAASPQRYVSPGTVDTASLAAVVSTLISAYGLRNHGRIRRVMRDLPLPYLSKILPGTGILANPFHFLTLCFSFLMLLLPLVSIPYFVWLDRVICAAIAGSMFVLGTRLAIAQGLMLLMSYSGGRGEIGGAAAGGKTGDEKKRMMMDGSSSSSSSSSNNSSVSAVVREIEAEPQVARVEDAQFWQVHYGLAMANLKLCLRGGGSGLDDGALSQLRSRIARVVQNRLGEGYGRGSSLRWEVTVQMSTDVN
ncbi:cation efflux family-domain-containing protein [Diplogelasinospora grovesii]|uniref:Zinc transporter n=1 Tax=Diplogelasinospora grovesii TaxID=303347 RepID=A0AAN6N7Q5_9PEZI|nr:cation efflux family-domain-containing protein [Diplogelasinospora grovesii]